LTRQIKVPTQANAVITDRQKHGYCAELSKLDANRPSLPLRKGVLQRVGDQLVQNETARNGLIHWHRIASISATSPTLLAETPIAWKTLPAKLLAYSENGTRRSLWIGTASHE